MKSCLITGATGLIGSNLINKLLNKYELYILTHNNFITLPKEICNINIDLSKEISFASLPAKIDIIIHLAQSVHFKEFPKHSSNIFNINTLSTLKFLEYGQLIGIKKFIYASSGGVYKKSEKIFSENDIVGPPDELGFYLSTKYCSEILVENYNRFFDINILRFFFVYGPNQRDSMLIPRIIKSVKEDYPIYLDGTEGIKINPIYVDDAVRAIEKVINLPGNHKINIAGSEILSLKDIANIIGEKIKKTPRFIYNDKTPNNIIGDISKMSKLLCVPRIKFSDGIDKLLDMNYETNEI